MFLFLGSSRLKLDAIFQEFSPDIVVCLDSWVGGIRQVNTSLHLKFPDSSKCVVSDLENFSFEDSDEKNRRVSDLIIIYDRIIFVIFVYQHLFKSKRLQEKISLGIIIYFRFN